MVLDRLHGYLPAVDAVARLALGAHLPSMNVRVAIGAPGTGVGEHRLGVALRAGHARVHPAQGIAGSVVIEFGNRADRLPPNCGVAVLASNVQISMWASRLRVALGLPARRGLRHQRENYCDQECRDQGAPTVGARRLRLNEEFAMKTY